MAKLSVYVADELLEQAKLLDPDMSPSTVLQTALRSSIHDRASRPYARLSPDLEAERAAAQKVVLDRVAAAYQVGYSVGLAVAKELPWEAFENFAGLDWNLQEWRSGFDDEEYEYINATEAEIAEGLSCLSFDGLLEQAMYHGQFPLDDTKTPIGMPAEGFVDAIRDVWMGARELRTDEAADRDDTAGADL